MGAALLLAVSDFARLPASSIAMVLVLLTTTMGAIPSAAGITAYVAACLVSLDVTYSGPVGVLPASGVNITLTDAGGSSCLVQPGGLVDARVSTPTAMTLHDPPGGWGCLAGVAVGGVKVDLDLAGFPDPTVPAVVVNVAGVIGMGLVAVDVLSFTGAGAFLQWPLDTATCAAGTGHSTTTWTGVLVFQDPLVEA
jgi:hypothetical protein